MESLHPPTSKLFSDVYFTVILKTDRKEASRIALTACKSFIRLDFSKSTAHMVIGGVLKEAGIRDRKIREKILALYEPFRLEIDILVKTGFKLDSPEQKKALREEAKTFLKNNVDKERQ